MICLILILAVIFALAGCAPEPTRTIDGWQNVVDQGWCSHD